MGIDLEALLAQLRDQDEGRRELRRLLIGDVPDLQEALVGLARAGERTERRLEALTEQVGVLGERIDALTERVDALTERVDALAAAQQRTEERMGQLAEQMAKLTQEVRAFTRRMDDIVIRADRAHGYLVERRYAEKGHAYFAPIARRLRPLGPVELDELLDAAGLSEDDADEVRYTDTVFVGRLRAQDTDGYLVVETSVTIGNEDLDRAHKRAFLLRLGGVNAVPVVAGEQISEQVSRSARRLGVWQVTDGSVLPPDDPEPRAGAA